MEPMIKGYIMQHAGRFILEDPGLRQRMPATILDEIRRNEAILKPTAWYPREELVRLWRAIAASQPDETSAYEALTRCGSYAGTQATNTFLKLLFKVLTPKMFARKFPDFFKRDHQNGGEAAVETIEDKRAVLLVRDVKGYDHFGPNTVGWAGVPLREMGLKDLKLTCSPWSLAEPGPSEFKLIATWS